MPCTKKEFEAISTNIRRVRTSLGLTQEQFGRLIEITQGQVARYEQGKSMPAAYIYMRVLAVDPEKK
jgi:transcriptional regulator with XRE-family HTH domain